MQSKNRRKTEQKWNRVVAHSNRYDDDDVRLHMQFKTNVTMLTVIREKSELFPHFSQSSRAVKSIHFYIYFRKQVTEMSIRSIQCLIKCKFYHFKRNDWQQFLKMSVLIFFFVLLLCNRLGTYISAVFCFWIAKETRSHFSSCETFLMLWIWIDLRLTVSLFISLSFTETKLKHIKSFTFCHFSSEFLQFVASVRYNRICLLRFFIVAHFQFLRLFYFVSYYMHECITLLVALCFQTMTSRVCGYLWQFVIFFSLLAISLFRWHYLCLCQRKC